MGRTVRRLHCSAKQRSGRHFVGSQSIELSGHRRPSPISDHCRAASPTSLQYESNARRRTDGTYRSKMLSNRGCMSIRSGDALWRQIVSHVRLSVSPPFAGIEAGQSTLSGAGRPEWHPVCLIRRRRPQYTSAVGPDSHNRSSWRHRRCIRHRVHSPSGQKMFSTPGVALPSASCESSHAA